jgi:hypothetical protein
MEADLSRLADEKEVLSHPTFQQFAETAERKVNDLNTVLLNDETVLNEKGLRIVQERGLWRAMLQAFGVKFRDEAIETLEAVMNKKLSN